MDEKRKQEKEAARRAYDNAKYEQENKPRDAEELRNAEAEDKKLADNFAALLGTTPAELAKMNDGTFDKYLSQNRRKVKKAGGEKKVRAARKQAKGGCAVVAIMLLGAFGAAGWGLVELIAHLVS